MHVDFSMYNQRRWVKRQYHHCVLCAIKTWRIGFSYVFYCRESHAYQLQFAAVHACMCCVRTVYSCVLVLVLLPDMSTKCYISVVLFSGCKLNICFCVSIRSLPYPIDVASFIAVSRDAIAQKEHIKHILYIRVRLLASAPHRTSLHFNSI